MSSPKESEPIHQDRPQALVALGEGLELALRNAIHLWADATTDAASACRHDLLRSKRFAVSSFFTHARKHPAEVSALDVKGWREDLEARGYQPATVYGRISRLSSFYEWARRDAALGRFITQNPAQLARPKCPKPYQTESAKALNDEQMGALLHAVGAKARAGDVVGKRDYSLLLFYVTTGMRRREVIALRGSDVELRKDHLVVRCRVKGGDYVGREVSDPLVRQSLLDYLGSCDRRNVLSTERPLWTRHDHAGKPGAALTSHAFAKNLKRYARSIGMEGVHIHQTRHTYARMVAEETGSMIETQDALGHRNLATTRVYVNRIAVKRDKHSRQITKRLKIGSET